MNFTGGFNSSRRLFVCICLLAGPLFCAPASAAIQYTITDLGTLGGASVGAGINSAGDVGGTSNTTATGSPRAFLYTNSLQNLGTLNGFDTIASAINDFGQVAGYSQGSSEHAFLWTPSVSGGVTGSLQDLGTLGGSFSNGWGINSSGQVTGFSDVPGGQRRAFIWNPISPNATTGTMFNIGSLGGSTSVGNGINTMGQVVGNSLTTQPSVQHAFLWTPSTNNGATGSMIDLGTLGGATSNALAINATGQVTGYAKLANGDTHAFFWTPTVSNGSSGIMQDLGSFGGLSCQGNSINSSGQITGFSNLPSSSDQHAFIYSAATGLIDINTLIDPASGWELEDGYGINDAGQITGYGKIGGQSHAFILTPVPEPSTFALAAMAPIALLFAYLRPLLHSLCAN